MLHCFTDGKNRRVQVFDLDGNFLRAFDGTKGGSRFGFTEGVAIDRDGNVLVTDNESVRILTPDGTSITEFSEIGPEKPLIYCGAICVDDSGRILVGDCHGVHVFAFD